MKRLPKRFWKQVHITIFALFWMVSIHAALAGADTTSGWYRVVSLVMIGAVLLVALCRFMAGPRRLAGRRSIEPVSEQ